MRYFLVAAEEMNFTSAAKRLYVTQQTLSSHIQRLEQEYQVTLFNRKPRLSLTPEGERMVKYATRIVRLERVMSGEFADLDQAAKGVPNSLQPHGLQHARLPCPSPNLCVETKFLM